MAEYVGGNSHLSAPPRSARSLADGLRGFIASMGGPVSSRMVEHSTQQRQRMATGDYSPTRPTGENIDLADSVAGGLVGATKALKLSAGLRSAAEGAAVRQAVPDLFVAHNLTTGNLLHADKLGGLPVPSMAIGRTTAGFENFGEITLLGSKELIDPRASKMNKVFNADVYSPRYPRVDSVVDARNMRNAWRRLEKSSADLGHVLSSELDDSEVASKGIKAFQESRAAKLQYLREHGQDIQIPVEKLPEIPDQLRQFVDAPPGDLTRDPAFIAAAQDAHSAMMKEAGLEPDEISFRGLNHYERNIRRVQQGDKPDFYEARKQIDAAIERQRPEFEEWTNDQFADTIKGERIITETKSGKRKYLPHDLESAVSVLKQQLRDGEGFNYGVGSLRSNVARQFKSVKEIQSARESIVAPEAMAKIKEEASDELVALADELAPYYRYDAKQFGYLDETTQALKGLATRGMRGFSEYYENVPQEMVDKSRAFLQKLTDLPTDYFEAKMQRAVGLDEFSAALVPNDAPSSVKKALSDKGVRIVEYDASKPGDRLAKLKAQKDLLFSVGAAGLAAGAMGVASTAEAGDAR